MMKLLLIGITFMAFSESKFLDNSEYSLDNILENVSNLNMSNSSKTFDTLNFVAETNRVILPNGTEFESSATSISLSNHTDVNELSDIITKRTVEDINDFEVETTDPPITTASIVSTRPPTEDKTANLAQDTSDQLSRGYFMLNSMFMNGLRYEDPYSLERKRSAPIKAANSDAKYDVKNKVSFMRRFVLI